MRSASSISRGVQAPKLVPVSAALRQRFHHLRMGMAHNQRPPGKHVVDVTPTIDIGHRGPLPLAMKTGSPPTARKARTGEFTPPGIELPGFGEEYLGFGWHGLVPGLKSGN